MSDAEPSAPPRMPDELASPSMLANALYLTSLALVAAGLYVTFSVTEIVGGAAYNYQIAAERGTALVATAIVAAIMGAAASASHAIQRVEWTVTHRGGASLSSPPSPPAA